MPAGTAPVLAVHARAGAGNAQYGEVMIAAGTPLGMLLALTYAADTSFLIPLQGDRRPSAYTHSYGR